MIHCLKNNDTLPARKKTGIDASKKSIIANSDLKKDESVFEMIVVPKAKNGNGGGSHANGNGNGGVMVGEAMRMETVTVGEAMRMETVTVGEAMRMETVTVGEAMRMEMA